MCLLENVYWNLDLFEGYFFSLNWFILNYYWSNYWHTLISKDTSGFTSNTFSVPRGLVTGLETGHLTGLVTDLETGLTAPNAPLVF